MGGLGKKEGVVFLRRGGRGVDTPMHTMVVPVFNNVGKGLQPKTTTLLVFFLWLVKSLKSFVNNGIVDHLKKCGFFFCRSSDRILYLIELLMLLTDLQHLIYPRLFTGFGMLVFFTNLGRMEFQFRYLALLLLFSVIDGFEWL